MTDSNNPIDTTSFFDNYAVRTADYRTRAEGLHEQNKRVLFNALEAAGITSVLVSFDGSGDSGQIEDIEARKENEQVSFPDGAIEIFSTSYWQPEISSHTLPIEEAVERMAYDFLSETHGGWENNDGAFGEFVFDVENRTISLDYNERFTSSDHYFNAF